MRGKGLIVKAWQTWRDEGLQSFFRKAGGYCLRRLQGCAAETKQNAYVDVLFVNGCPLQHPYRYRVQHQREQLEMAGLSTAEVTDSQLEERRIYLCRSVVIYRCPHTPVVEDFIRRAQFFNKKVFFDIDDLVIDTKYTNQIPFVSAMKAADKRLYDDGVERYRRTMQLCDGVITSTEGMAKELAHYMDEVFVNRNVASELLVSLSNEAREKRAATDDALVTLGYFSGSITHNDDMEMLLPVLARLLSSHENLRLLLVGELDLPEKLKKYEAQIIFHEFVDWTKLPELIAKADINLVPLRDTVFNRAKSENKWLEAALVGVPTVASDVGALKHAIKEGETGFLCKTADDWQETLTCLIADAKKRQTIGERARTHVLEHCTTITSCGNLHDFICSHRSESMVMVLPSFNISGGVLVALKHADMLRRHGLDITLLSTDDNKDGPAKVAWSDDFAALMDRDTELVARFDKGIATMWLTVPVLDRIVKTDKYYLVQGYEADFYPLAVLERFRANATYWRDDVKYLTISKWCEQWLAERYGRKALYAPNGLERKMFEPVRRKMEGKIRILIEGDNAVEYKNVDEAFRIAELLPADSFEIWYVSYNARPKKWYRVDRFLQKVPPEEMPALYRQCHILLKTSFQESFSYPPLEMMATGGFVVVRPNGGNKEYLVDEENCLLYAPEDISTAVEAVNRLKSDEDLREKLYHGGCRTADERDWANCEERILAMYE